MSKVYYGLDIVPVMPPLVLLQLHFVNASQMPPLPARPVVDARDAELKSKKYLGLTSKTLIGDELDKDCRHLEKYVYSYLSQAYMMTIDCATTLPRTVFI